MKRFDLEDIMAAGGLASIAAGLWMFQPWVALTVVGIILIAVSILRAL